MEIDSDDTTHNITDKHKAKSNSRKSRLREKKQTSNKRCDGDTVFSDLTSSRKIEAGLNVFLFSLIYFNLKL